MLLLAFVVLLPGCGSDDSSDETGDHGRERGITVELTATDFKFDPAHGDVDAAGTTTFRLKNEGGTTHALEIEGHGIEEETDEIGPGESARRSPST